jgi:tetratricopeptide (TPR) repeat protein
MNSLEKGVAAQIRLRLQDGTDQALREAIEIAALALADADNSDDETARAVFDAAFQCERLNDYRTCVALYRTITAFAVEDRLIHAGAWFRIGWCSELTRDWRTALQSYKTALELGPAWDHMVTLARYRLAGLLIAAEDYEAAEKLCGTVSQSLPHSEIRIEELVLTRVQCLAGLRRYTEARTLLETLRPACASSFAVRVDTSLSRICELLGDRDGALEASQRIISDPEPDPQLKSLVAYRIAALRA